MKELLPSGVLMVRGVNGINPGVPPLEAAQRTASQNRPEILESLFTSPDVLYRSELDGGQIAIVIPSAPYTEGALMVVARGKLEYPKPDGPAQLIYHLPLDVQEAYWRLTLNSLDALNKLNSDRSGGQRYVNLAVENSVSQVSRNYRTSRTIAIPHIHIISVDTAQIKEGDLTVPNLETEQKLIQKIQSPEFYRHMNKSLFPSSDEDAPVQGNITKRDAKPYGYQVDVNPHTPQEFSEFMLRHHEAYSAFTLPRWDNLNPRNKQRVIPPPSYRLYIQRQETSTRIIVSPEILSNAGVLEASGVRLDRSPQHPVKLPEAEVLRLRQTIVSEAISNSLVHGK